MQVLSLNTSHVAVKLKEIKELKMIKLISICACIGGLILATRLLFQASLIAFKSILKKA